MNRKIYEECLEIFNLYPDEYNQYENNVDRVFYIVEDKKLKNVIYWFTLIESLSDEYKKFLFGEDKITVGYVENKLLTSYENVLTMIVDSESNLDIFSKTNFDQNGWANKKLLIELMGEMNTFGVRMMEILFDNYLAPYYNAGKYDVLVNNKFDFLAYVYDNEKYFYSIYNFSLYYYGDDIVDYLKKSLENEFIKFDKKRFNEKIDRIICELGGNFYDAEKINKLNILKYELGSI